MEYRDIYLDAIGLASTPTLADQSGNDACAPEVRDPMRKARLAALTRSHEIRQFEIDLYWKRATYFWLLQGAVFAAVGLTWKNTTSGVPAAVPVLLSALGVVTAAASYFSSMGSKFWQENWEHHIDMLEDEFEGRLHKTAYVGARGIQWSVSGLNERLGLCFAAFWLLILAAATHAGNPDWTFQTSRLDLCSLTLTGIATIASWAGAIGGTFFLYVRPSHMRGTKAYYTPCARSYPDLAPSDQIQRGPPPLWSSRNRRPFLAKREPRI
jgi:hypothetical protein